MYGHLIFAISIIVTVHNGPRARAMPPATSVPLTRHQLQLIVGVYQKEHWRDLWFSSVYDGEEWEVVSRLSNPACRPGPWKKLRLMPRIMGCMYGAKLHWFLSLAIRVIDECTRLSQHHHDSTGHCWNTLGQCLRKCSDTVLYVMRSLAYIYATIGYDTDLDGFYAHLSTIRNFLGQHSVAECTVVLPDGLNYFQLVETLIANLETFLSSGCRPEHPPLNIDESTNEHQTRFPLANRYDYYAHNMEYYLKEHRHDDIDVAATPVQYYLYITLVLMYTRIW
ncbi:uncharacterized protein LOC126846684 [Adelges cooleyi]|uniref:uncharacterized protein LOC126846684 n=1 Tax=Adelges cooleyi TaxID=133065 RepID=UPI00217FC02B|nr:uncharacterized protein LOC126846684 [Adelges cooleyi]